jgi:hypothetical protein
MVEHRRGNPEKAKAYFEKSQQWCAEHDADISPSSRQLLESLRKRAQAMLNEPAGKEERQ